MASTVAVEIHIDPGSSEPIFEQIAFQVKRSVARGEVPAGTRLPSVRQLARELAVNPNTVVRAYDVLESDGIVVRRKGSGCFTTDRGSDLDATRRQEELERLVRRTATEAFHLGFTAREIRAALAESLRALDFKARKRAPVREREEHR